MSKIRKKGYDPNHKIERAIFHGSPNLFTTEDLNRQIEMLKAQINMLEAFVGFTSDGVVTAHFSELEGVGQVSYVVDYNYLYYRGCSFNPAKLGRVVSCNVGEKLFVVLTATMKEVTFEQDPECVVSGASFEDGFKMPAATHYVYSNEEISAVKSLDGVQNLVGIIAEIFVNDAKEVVVRSNLHPKHAFIGGGFVASPSVPTPPTPQPPNKDLLGDLFTRYRHPKMVHRDGSRSMGIKMRYAIKGGNLNVELFKGQIPQTDRDFAYDGDEYGNFFYLGSLDVDANEIPQSLLDEFDRSLEFNLGRVGYCRAGEDESITKYSQNGLDLIFKYTTPNGSATISNGAWSFILRMAEGFSSEEIPYIGSEFPNDKPERTREGYSTYSIEYHGTAIIKNDQVLSIPIKALCDNPYLGEEGWD